ncbi:aliphatic sulfonate ABC transporter substrate-binding protein [Ligilactobacillus sp. WILCCON 0076]|uniref:Putative aliphatic sulfonates-binding protein n=1 Tax=Ligilactobacillus ubinensis TaxID=2876789 RepID=A0A9X2FK64_9LACO|nr:aliphatic sulfonate ABC transporter substrate-binding protein [Ligilactobacillus ubinensis]MCP0887182.1 aliphatic sulfonate ABC transporter substrate-binding protein [Ligilactobacillus ubinensis]
MKKKNSVRKIFILGLVVLGVLVAFFGWKQTQDSTSKSLKKVIIGYQAGDEFDISKTRGEFVKKMKKAGYSVTFKEFQNGAAMMQALANGNIDYGRMGDSAPITSIAAGTKVTYVAAGGTKALGSGVVVKKDSGINSISDLKGKTIAYTKGTTSQYMIIKVLKKAGLTTSDVNLVNLDQSAASVAYAKGKVDAWANWDPAIAQAEVTENSKLLINGNQSKAYNRSVIVATTSFAKNNKSVTKAIIKYSNQDMQWANTHHKKLIAMMVKSLKLNKKVVTKMVNRRTYSMHAMTKARVAEFQEIADVFYENKIISKKVSVAKYTQYVK